MPTLDEIRDNFAFLDDWDDRMSYVIELGKALPPFPEEARTTPTRYAAAPARSGCRAGSTPTESRV